MCKCNRKVLLTKRAWRTDLHFAEALRGIFHHICHFCHSYVWNQLSTLSEGAAVSPWVLLVFAQRGPGAFEREGMQMFMKVGRQTRKLISLLFHNYSFEKDIVNHIGSRRQKEKQLIFRFILQNTFLIPIALFIPPLSEHFVLVPLSLRPLPEKPSVLWLVSAHRPEQAQPHCISTSTLSVSLQPQDCARSIAERSDCIFVT